VLPGLEIVRLRKLAAQKSSSRSAHELSLATEDENKPVINEFVIPASFLAASRRNPDWTPD
jgi:hypothetical protein